MERSNSGQTEEKKQIILKIVLQLKMIIFAIENIAIS